MKNVTLNFPNPMTHLNNKTLASIVNEHNSTAEVFDKYHLDYCIYGDLLLSESVTKTKISLEQLLNELDLVIKDEPVDNVNFNNLSLAEISELLRNEYHEYLRGKISELTSLSQKVQKEHKFESIDEIHELLLSIFNHLAPHMLREEKVLFPYLEYMEHMVIQGKIPRPPSFGKIKTTISAMLEDHKDSTDKLNELRELTNNYTCPDEGCENMKLYYEELNLLDKNLRMHVHIENNVLFTKAREMEKGFNSKA
jgi:regulator of cell morphogenesis and NO signaling